jgi:hypothetical protein
VLEVVISHPAGEWPAIDEWARLLPSWFVTTCVDDRELRNCVLDRWSLRAWLHWLQPEHRKWRWWDAKLGSRELQIELLVFERPYLKGALEWLLRVAAVSGAS